MILAPCLKLGRVRMRLQWTRSSCFRRIAIASAYLLIVMVQLYMWPVCEDDSSSTLAEDIEDIALDLPPLPLNPLSPPLWNSEYPTGGCGSWQKQYTKLHRAITSGEQPPAYLVYTTGKGFPPNIESIPQALKGIATALMLAVLTERAFILDWSSPAGFDYALVPRYIDWRTTSLPDKVFDPNHTHRIGTTPWIEEQGNIAQWYMDTDFNEYFTQEIEVIQAHNFDFTYALLYNKHYRHKIQHMGLHESRCALCCIWHYLFKFSQTFRSKMNNLMKRELRITPKTELLYINLPLMSENLPKRLITNQISKVMTCAEKISGMMKNSVWVLASNSLSVLEEVHKKYPKIRAPYGLMYTGERYMVDLQRQNSSHYKSVRIPRTEQNALMNYFLGYYLQINSTVLFSEHHFAYSEIAAASRHFVHPSKTYTVYPDKHCQMQRYGH